MKIDGFYDYDIFNDMIVFKCKAKEIDNRFIDIAKCIDGENYCDSCFGTMINYDRVIDQFENNNLKEQLFYIDIDGTPTLFDVQFNLEQCVNSICEKLFVDFEEIYSDYFSPEGILLNDWFVFKSNTHDKEICNWFDNHHSKGIGCLKSDFKFKEEIKK